MIGSTISHYRILKELGEGGMGTVYLAEDLKLGRRVALKFLPESAMRDARVRQRFLREARSASALAHQNICTIYEIDEDGSGRTFISMACCDGESLDNRIRRGQIPVGEAVKIAIQIAQGLSAAHKAGITHRDIKPGNVMVSDGGDVRIVDFGLAKLSGQTSLTKSGGVVGTVSYMSPEQARGLGVDARTDIWSLGVVIYEMVSGRRPFDGENQQSVIRAILHDRQKALGSYETDVPPELEGITDKALEKRASRRYQDINEMLGDLRELSRQIDASQIASTQTWAYARSRERVLRAAAIASGLVAVALVVGWAVVSWQRGDAIPDGIPRRVTSAEGWEGQPALSPDGSRIAYASTESGNYDVFVVDVHGGSKIQLTRDPGLDFGPAWFPDGTELAFVSDRSGSRDIWRVSQFGGGATTLIENADLPAISPDGTRIAFQRPSQSGETRICVAPLSDPSSVTVLAEDEHGHSWQEQPAWSPDGRQICYSTEDRLWTVAASGGKPRPLTTGEGADHSPAWSPDGQHVYFQSYREGTLALWRIPSRGGEPQRLSPGTNEEGDPCVSRDGRRLAYSTGTASDRAVLVDLDTGAELVIPGVEGDCMVTIAPDRSRIVYAASHWGRNRELAVRELVDGVPSAVPTRLTDQPGNASHPIFSPDGAWIAYYRIDEGERDIWVIPADGGGPVRITDDPTADRYPAWSPDGSELAFVSERTGTREIWAIPLQDGAGAGEPRRVTTCGVSAAPPAWSPDGKHMAFVRQAGDRRDVWVVPADGSGRERQVTAGTDALRVRWDSASGSIL
ncbi:serine/threonine-protein kinase, partial [bacterium]|nr:serine/threonine-protein kinase [bacterium]